MLFRSSYFIGNTGFPTDERGCLSEPKPSPYPYDEHSMIYYCDDLPHPTQEHEAFIEQGVQRLLEVLEISGGKALVLFTAKTDMEEVYTILSKLNLPYKVLMQQPGSSQDKILNEFREDTNSVLLGTGAYWEGISIEGIQSACVTPLFNDIFLMPTHERQAFPMESSYELATSPLL